MTYVTKQELIDRYSERSIMELTDRDGSYPDQINDNVLNAAIADAAAVINSFVSKRYDLPLGQTPPVLRLHAAAISYYFLHNHRHTDEVKASYDAAIAYLKLIANGTALLDIDGSEPASAPAQVAKAGPARIFSRESLKGY